MPLLRQLSINPVEAPATPPVSVVIPALSARRLWIKFRMELVSMLSRRRAGSTLSVLTKQRFSQSLSAPAFSPQMPPVSVRPRTAPEAVQETIMPLTSLRPAMPPTWARASTSPLKLQPVITPRLRPAMPPTMLSSPWVWMLPLMLRSRMSASLPVSRMKPQGDWTESRSMS